MSARAYTEGKPVEQPAIGLFAELGWQTASALEEIIGANGTFGLDEGRVGVGAPVARGVGAAESRAAAGRHHRRRG